MAAVDYTGLVAGQREYFRSGATRPAEWRRQQLEALKALLEENRARFFAALHQDLRRNDTDSDLMDVGFCIKEAEYALKHLHHWMKAERELTPLLLEPGHVRVRRDPLGVTLIIGAWNADADLRPARPGARGREHGRGQAMGDVRRHLGTGRRTGSPVPGHQRSQARMRMSQEVRGSSPPRPTQVVTVDMII